MNFDEVMMLLNALGSWVAGAGSLAAVGVALWLARRVEKIKLDAWVGHRVLVGAGTKAECLGIMVTNLGERPVTINSIGWTIGLRKESASLYPTNPTVITDQVSEENRIWR